MFSFFVASHFSHTFWLNFNPVWFLGTLTETCVTITDQKFTSIENLSNGLSMLKLCGLLLDLFFETCFSVQRIISVMKKTVLNVNILLFHSPNFDLKGTWYMDKQRISLRYFWWPLKGPVGSVDVGKSTAYLELVYLVTALVPSDTACLASSPGRRSLTAVWISREVMVDLLL